GRHVSRELLAELVDLDEQVLPVVVQEYRYECLAQRATEELHAEIQGVLADVGREGCNVYQRGDVALSDGRFAYDVPAVRVADEDDGSVDRAQHGCYRSRIVGHPAQLVRDGDGLIASSFQVAYHAVPA